MIKLDVLEKARACIIYGFTKHQYARDHMNRRVSPCDPEACKWCAVGALYHAMGKDPVTDINGDEFHDETLEYMDFLCHGRGYVNTAGLIGWNDEVEQADVVELYDNAITRAERMLAA